MRNIDLNFIAPPEAKVTIDGAEFIVRPITMKLLPGVLAHVEPILDELLHLMDAPTVVGAARLVIKHGGRLAAAVALCAGTDVATIEAMTPDRVAALLLVCCEVNVDFFSKAAPAVKEQSAAAAPQLLAKFGPTIKAMSSGGPMPSAA